MLEIEHVLDLPIPRSTIKAHSVLGNMQIIRCARGTRFRVTPQEDEVLWQMAQGYLRAASPGGDLPRLQQAAQERPAVDAASSNPACTATLQDLILHFAAALRDCHLEFGPRHDDFVRTFVVSLATKPFVILTGLSGSGKPQIALKFGQWLGPGRFRLVPVRPDWTGAEALFGYEDALAPRIPSRPSAWYAPEILRFMLAAARDPAAPYLLVLDEMNLAHVERYFADVLSGMESNQPCLPNMFQDDGHWRMRPGEPERIPFPPNLFVAGTVNVDETTYVFSPKVLDRANVLEFRVATDDLQESPERPSPCSPSPDGMARRFLEIARDSNPSPSASPGEVAFTAALRQLHRILAEDGYEFGHRVYHEAVRFSRLYAECGGDPATKALDAQVMQKLLPRLHGSRRQIESLLVSMAAFCHGKDVPHAPSAPGDPLDWSMSEARLPMSFDKVCRMLRRLRSNQFVSFTE